MRNVTYAFGPICFNTLNGLALRAYNFLTIPEGNHSNRIRIMTFPLPETLHNADECRHEFYIENYLPKFFCKSHYTNHEYVVQMPQQIQKS